MNIKLNKEESQKFEEDVEFFERIVNILDEDPDYFTKSDLIEIIWGTHSILEELKERGEK